MPSPRRIVSRNSAAAAAIAFCLGTAAGVHAAGDGTYQTTPEKFVLIFHKVGLCTSLSCPSPAIIGTQTVPYDIAAAAPGGAIGTFSQGATLPPATYTHMYIVLGRDIVYRGRIRMSHAATSYDCLTNGSAQDAQRGVIDGELRSPGTGSTRDITARFAPMFVVGHEFTEGGSRLKVASESQIEAVMPLAQPIVVSSDKQAPTMRISIDAAGALWGGINDRGPGNPPACYLYGEAPIINIRTE